MRESEVAQSCPTLSDPVDCSTPASSVHGIFQARVLEWGAITFSGFLILLSVKYTSSMYAHMFSERLLLVLSTYMLPNNLQILAYRDCDLLKVKYWEIVY